MIQSLFHDKRSSVGFSFVLLFVFTFSIALYPTIVQGDYRISYLPRAETQLEYSGNVFLATDDQEQESESILLLRAGFNLGMDGRQNGLTLDYAPSYSIYSNNSDNNTLRHALDLNAWQRLSKRSELNLTGSFQRTEDPFGNRNRQVADNTESTDAADPQSIEPQIEPMLDDADGTIRRGRQPYNQTKAGLGWSYQFSTKNSVNLNYDYSRLDNDDEALQDNQRHAVGGGLTWEIYPRLTMDVELTFSYGIFENDSDDLYQYGGLVGFSYQLSKKLVGLADFEVRTTDYDGDREGYTVYAPSVGMEYNIAKGFDLSLSLGYYLQTRSNREDESGFTVDGNIGKTWAFKRGSFRINGSSGYEENFFGAENLGFTVFWQVDAGADYALTKQLRWNASGSYREDDYKDQADDRKDDLWTVGTGLSYKPEQYKWLRCSLDYDYRMRDSNNDRNTYTEDRVTFLISVAPSSRIPINR